MKLIDLKHGDILICIGKGEVAKGISTATNSPFTHTAQVMNINGNLCVFDAQKEGAFPRGLDEWLEEFKYDFEVYRFNAEFSGDTFTKACIKMWGYDYSYLHLSVGFWRKIFAGKDVKKKYGQDGKVVCTELTMRLMWVFGKRVNDPENYQPKDVRYFLQNNNFVFKGKYISQ